MIEFPSSKDLASRDEEACEKVRAILMMYAKQMSRTNLHVVNELEDLVQEVFFVLWKAVTESQPVVDDLGKYAYAVMRNKLFGTAVATKKLVQGEFAQVADYRRGADEIYIRDERLRLLGGVLKGMSPLDRSMIIMAREGEDPEKIMLCLDLTPTQYRLRRSRAIASARERLFKVESSLAA